ncbi:Ras family protein [Legionella gratiana]|uniref:Ras family protein n=1 Tax=Legionella gratiana TaxID=45066 RepID=A0A378JDR2_9GAMM|nr:GTP-binding protein [Legionella gratiana]KTD09186.1 Ras family protein [Legionella gratiana]STX45599.1 Ribosomal protein L23 [Legionella gratiana]
MPNIKQIVASYGVDIPEYIEYVHIPDNISNTNALIDFLNNYQSISNSGMDPETLQIDKQTFIQDLRNYQKFIDEAIQQQISYSYQEKSQHEPSKYQQAVMVSSSSSSSSASNSGTFSDKQQLVIDQMRVLLSCPIYLDILKKANGTPSLQHTFIDPVTTPNGYTYEKKWLISYLAQNGQKTPTGERINNADQQLIPNLFIKDAADNFRSRQSIAEQNLSDPILFGPLDKNAVLSPYGHTYDLDNITQLTKCPFTRKPLSKDKFRPNLLIQEVAKFYNDNIDIFEPKPLTSVSPPTSVSDFENIHLNFAVRALRDLINRFPQDTPDNSPSGRMKNGLTALYTVMHDIGQNSASLKKLGLIINSLSTLIIPENRNVLRNNGISQLQLANSLHDSFSVLRDLIEKNAVQIDQIEPVQVGRAKNYLSKCNLFLDEISLRQHMFTPNSGVLFASSQRNDKFSKMVIRKQNNQYTIEIDVATENRSKIEENIQNFLTQVTNSTKYKVQSIDTEKGFLIRIQTSFDPYILCGFINFGWLSEQDINDINPDLLQRYEKSMFKNAMEHKSKEVKKEFYMFESLFNFFKGKDSNTTVYAPIQVKDNMKMVVVGDNGVGKTSFLHAFTNGEFPFDYVPHYNENPHVTFEYDSQTVALDLWDTVGSEEYARIRSLSYPNTDAFIVCYNVCDKRSLDHVQEFWYPELHHHCPNAKIILVGLKEDLRYNPIQGAAGRTLVTSEEGEAVARKIGAYSHVIVSALEQRNLSTPFYQAIEAVSAGLEQSKNDTSPFLI